VAEAGLGADHDALALLREQPPAERGVEDEVIVAIREGGVEEPVPRLQGLFEDPAFANSLTSAKADRGYALSGVQLERSCGHRDLA
jgi:hypothetical protein